MAFIHRDFLTPAVHQWNMFSRIYHRFNKVWGTHLENGIEVYDDRLIYWDRWNGLRTDKPFKRLLSALGVEYSELEKADYKGAQDVYLKLDPKKYDFQVPTAGGIASILNAASAIGEEFTLTIHYSGTNLRLPSDNTYRYTNRFGNGNLSSPLNYEIDPVEIRTVLESDPMKYFLNGVPDYVGTSSNQRIRQITGTTFSNDANSRNIAPMTVVDVLDDTNPLTLVLAVLDNGTVYQQVRVTEEKLIQSGNRMAPSVDYSYKVVYKRIADATDTSYITQQILTAANSIVSSYTDSKSAQSFALSRARVSNYVEDTTLKTAIYEMNNAVLPAELLENGFIRTDQAALMKRKEFCNMLGSVITSGYTKKKTKWWKKLIAGFLILLSIVIGVLSAGGLAAVSSSLISMATALAVSAGILSVSLIIYAAAFPYATDMIRLIGKFAQIIGLLASILGIWSTIQNAFNKLAQAAAQKAGEEAAKQGMSDAAIKEVANQALNNYGIGDFVNDMFGKLFDDVTTKLSNMFSFDSISNMKFGDLTKITLNDVSGWLDNLSTGMKLYMRFFNDQPKSPNTTEDDQAVKEDGVEPYYTSLNMLDDVDALSRISMLKDDNFGGAKTERFLTKIY